MAHVWDPAFESVARALAWLRRAESPTWTLERWMAASGLSRETFRAFFVQATGVMPERFFVHWQAMGHPRGPEKKEIRSSAPVSSSAPVPPSVAKIQPALLQPFTDPQPSMRSVVEDSLAVTQPVEAAFPDRSGRHRVRLYFEPFATQRSGRVEIHYTFGPTLWGPAFVAFTERGVCFLGWAETPQQALTELRAQFRGTVFRFTVTEEEEPLQILSLLRFGEEPISVRLHLWGTEFQRQVWRALTKIPAGTSLSYGELARRIGRPTACRAVGSAVGANPVSGVIPCHRVLQGSGRLGGYRWGVARKRELLAWEKALQEIDSSHLMSVAYEDRYL